ncbi:hypothetical protein [Paludibaculum fermentans]|uniref:hypothetical protein n=1 Tax=Paludibaculum fermentans TaxID=1473598 RepID=UPI003EB87DB0
MIGIGSLLLAWAIGWPWVRASRACDGLRPRWMAWILEALLALPVGLAATAALSFALLWAGLGAQTAVHAADGLLALCGIAGWFLRRGSIAGQEETPAPPGFKWTWLPAMAFAVGMVLFAAGFFAFTNGNPQGNWDAWSSWNLRAKFLTDASTWRLAITAENGLANADAPLLWPSVVARGWVYGGATGDPRVPIAASFLFSAAIPLLLGFALALLRSPALGWLGGVILLTSTPLWRQAPGQYADMPVGCLMLASLIVAALAERRKWDPGVLALSGLLAALAASAKNEGAVFFVLLAAALAWQARVKTAAWLGGSLPALLLAVGFPLLLAPKTAGLSFSLLADVSRGGAVLRNFLDSLLQLGEFPAHPVLLFAALAFVLKLRAPRAPWWPVIVPAVLLLADLLVLWITPPTVGWQIDTALDRKMVQLIAPLLFAGLLLIRVPETLPEPAEPQDRSEARSRRRSQR